jgi:peptidoglycan/LPS O-acetylase OafA/YrhL
MDDPRVEQYLQTIARQLGASDPARRDDELRELRQHLETLIAGHRARGLADNAAVETALHQFGHAEQLGRDLGRITVRRAPRLWPVLCLYLGMVALIFGLFATANDKPTDFPATWGGQLALAIVLPAGMLTMRLIDVVRARWGRAHG